MSALLPSGPEVSPKTFAPVVALAVGLWVFATAVLITFIMPETYCSMARVKVDNALVAPFALADDQQWEIVQKLQLDTAWGKRFGLGEPLSRSESLPLLRNRVMVEVLPKTPSIVQARAYSEQPAEAAALANAVAEAIISKGGAMIDLAVPGLRPVRPNKPLNLALGAGFGVLAGAAAGVILPWLGRWFKKRFGIVVARPA